MTTSRWLLLVVLSLIVAVVALGCSDTVDPVVAADAGRTTDSGRRGHPDTTDPGRDATPDIGPDMGGPSVCGDGAQQVGEECDDGNDDDDDACTSDCTINEVGFCEACVADIQCGGAEDSCVPIGDGTFCAQACVETTDCARGFSCDPLIIDGAHLGDLCLPVAGACEECLDEDEDGICDDDDLCAGEDDTIDEDEDGVPDCADSCPGDPDNTDTDGDTICDSADVCPAGDDRADEDDDGIPNACDDCPSDNPNDSDGDGVCDSADLCAGEDDSVDVDEDGTPDGCDDSVEICTDDRDNDGDGIVDCEDTDCARHSACGPCDAPVVIDGFTTVTGETEEGVDEGFESADCGSEGGGEAVFQFTPEESGTVCATSVGSEFDTVIYVRTTCGDPESELGCDDDGDEGTTSRIDWPVEAGVTYYIVVDGYSSSQFGNYQVAVRDGFCDGVVEGPVCDGIQTTDGFGTYAGTTSGDSLAAGVCAVSRGPEAVWSFTAPATGTVCVNGSESDYDTVLYVRSTCTERESEIACDDDIAGAKIEWDAASGTRYFVFVDGLRTTDAGDYSLTFSEGSCDAAACADTETADGFGTYTGILIGSSDSDGTCRALSGPDDIWAFTATANGTVCAYTTGDEVDTVLYVRTECGDTGSEVACDDDGGDGLNSMIEFSATSGQTYYFFVDGFGAFSEGGYTLNINEGSCPG